ncbi:MAG: LPS export ABC transporter permease LptG [Magnetococcus sp. WYHC-3]
MPILFRYLMVNFLGGFLKVLGVFVGVFFLLDGAEQIRRFGAMANVTSLDLAGFLLLRLPGFLVQFLPPLTLLCTLMVMHRLNRQNEITVIRACGVAIHRALLPFLAGAVVVALALWGVQEGLAPWLDARARALEARFNGQDDGAGTLEHGQLWLRDGSRILYARQVSAPHRALFDVVVYQFDDQQRLVARQDARRALLRETGWVLEQGTAYVFGEHIQAQTFHTLPSPLDLTVAQLERGTPNPSALTFGELAAFAHRLEHEGYDATGYHVALQRKLADPVLVVAAVLLGFPFSLRLSRLGGTVRSAAMGLTGGFGLFVLVDVFTALGMGGRLPPLAATWIPVLFSFALGGFLLLHLEEKAVG